MSYFDLTTDPITKAAAELGMYDPPLGRVLKIAGLLEARESLRVAMIATGVDHVRVATLARYNAELIGLGWSPVA